VQLVDGEPPQSRVLDRRRFASNNTRQPYPQNPVLADRPITTNARAEHDVDRELLAALANECGLVGLARVNFSPRKLPESGERGWLGPLRGEHPFAVHDGGTDDHLHGRVHSRAVCHDPALTPPPSTDDGGFMQQQLSAVDVARALAELTDWTGDTTSLRRSVKASSFAAGIRLVDAVAEIADAMDHHPDIDIRWTTITFTCSTHSAGGVTELDVALARLIDDLAGS
jgi:4a-hydroxytetrahydrobiopterin dehydratase